MQGDTIDTNTIEVRIAKRRQEADDIISLELVPAGDVPLPSFEAGSHVEVQIGKLIRHYSLCNDPRERHLYRLGILLDAASRGGSAEIHRTFREGLSIQISRPKNNFRLVESDTRSVLLAGGIGITPLMAMAYRLIALSADFEFHYCVRTRSKAAFLNTLNSAPFGHRVALHVDDEAVEQRLDLRGVIGPPDPKTHLYICGPTGFMNFVIDGAKGLGWPPENIHTEYFTAEVDVRGDAFTVEAVRSGVVCEVPADKTIAEVLAEHGIEVAMSCEQGVCGTCLTPVIEGIPDHRDVVQTNEERATNSQMTLCCSRSKTRLLRLDI